MTSHDLLVGLCKLLTVLASLKLAMGALLATVHASLRVTRTLPPTELFFGDYDLATDFAGFQSEPAQPSIAIFSPHQEIPVHGRRDFPHIFLPENDHASIVSFVHKAVYVQIMLSSQRMAQTIHLNPGLA
ncbi:uncharacterized protein LACBIDRAFT_330466 [Laccaria bicolor S238N-H82]|uniref:Predicted protein n=1 Tax=Laccaria bicolor (strain S238N-H82 / ATCC MYA-4686) TaxID=486041 RepID=B0DLD8_LACBS|nr:uncharacterized protein LACBIDRAFT_330466 [Laccaria bicolor S238N-H82]EDR04549.1 predicted protein [Laccaria bicolor S238N-H82]|eukprot:XP_001884721.1 predicted protein [Laccaria bicolor S238N-H82]